jgi:SAM-dependent methyltransferase
MTESQIEIARKYQNEQAARFGYTKPNVHFIHDYIENLENHFPDNSIDLIVSNCVVNLIEEKERLLRQIHKVLKDGGSFTGYLCRQESTRTYQNPVPMARRLGGLLWLEGFRKDCKEGRLNDPPATSKRVSLNIK